MILFDDNDIQSLALCAWKEARGEGVDGMRAVMHVILHRAKQWYLGETGCIHEAVFAKNQFTSMSVPSDIEFDLRPQIGDTQFNYCMNIARSVLEEKDLDVTHGALYYANLRTATSGWFFDNIVKNKEKHPEVAVIGKQTFFK